MSFRGRRPRRARRRGRPNRRSSHGCGRGRPGRRPPGCGHGRPGCGSGRRTCRFSSPCPARSWSRRPEEAAVVVWPWGTEAAVVWPLGAEVAGAVRPAEAAVGEAEAARPAEAAVGEAEAARPAEVEEAEAAEVAARSAADGDSCRQGPAEEFRRRREPSRSAGRLPRRAPGPTWSRTTWALMSARNGAPWRDGRGAAWRARRCAHHHRSRRGGPQEGCRCR